MTGTEPTVADRAVLDAWFDACAREPGRLPNGVAPVQTRLVRAVGRAELPDAGPVYLKTMGFPRFRDRLRYVHRALPAIHEADLLRRLAGHGVPCPAVVATFGRRAAGCVPKVSLLVTRSLGPIQPLDFDAAAELAARLASLGLFHPDLNPGNFARLADGRAAVLDLQSARWRRSRSLRRGRRRSMAAKLLLEFGAAERAARLVEVGLVRTDEIPTVRRGAAARRGVERRRRILRCLTNSSEFVVERRWNGAVYRRRALTETAGSWVAHPAARQLWIGDRMLQVTDGAAPVLGAMFRKSWWRPGASRVYILGGDGTSLPNDSESRLLDGFERFRTVARA